MGYCGGFQCGKIGGKFVEVLFFLVCSGVVVQFIPRGCSSVMSPYVTGEGVFLLDDGVREFVQRKLLI